jgi:hypothetical protein
MIATTAVTATATVTNAAIVDSVVEMTANAKSSAAIAYQQLTLTVSKAVHAVNAVLAALQEIYSRNSTSIATSMRKKKASNLSNNSKNLSSNTR